MKKILGAIAIAFLFFGMTAVAHAAIFIDFDSLPLTPDTSSGDFSHTLSTAYGDITFNGRIWDKINRKDVADHSSGDGYFLKNTNENNKVTMTFDFDVETIDLWMFTARNVTFNGAIYDIYGNEIGTGDIEAGTGKWVEESNISSFNSTPIRSVSFWTSPGNRAAIDDITIDPLVRAEAPEPCSMVLLGLGLAGVARLRKKQ